MRDFTLELGLPSLPLYLQQQRSGCSSAARAISMFQKISKSATATNVRPQGLDWRTLYENPLSQLSLVTGIVLPHLTLCSLFSGLERKSSSATIPDPHSMQRLFHLFPGNVTSQNTEHFRLCRHCTNLTMNVSIRKQSDDRLHPTVLENALHVLRAFALAAT